MTAPTQRHATLTRMTDLLDRIIRGRSAEDAAHQLRRSVDAGCAPDYGALWFAPNFGWLPPRINMGRKTRGYTHEVPVRLSWAFPALIIPVENPASVATVEVSWTTTSMGHSGSGSVAITPSSRVWDWADDAGLSGIPTFATGAIEPLHALLRRLDDAVADGSLARFQLAAMCRDWAFSTARRAALSLGYDAIALETNARDAAPLLDDLAIESVVDQYLYGIDGSVDSPFLRSVDRILAEGGMDRVDPQRRLMVELDRDVPELVRRRLGEPRIGRRFRGFISENRDLLTADLATIIAAFNTAHPGARLHDERAIAALTLGADLDARSASLEALIDLSPDDVRAVEEVAA